MASQACTHPQLCELIRELDATTAHARRLVESHDDRAFSAKPAPGSWSAAEAIGHLTITNRHMVERIERALAEGDRRLVDDAHRYRMDFFGAALRWSQEPPYRMKAPTAPGFEATNVPDRHQVLAEFLEQQRAVADTINRSQGRNLAAIKVTSPFNARLRYNVFAALRVITTHNRRHLWQAEKALAHAK